MLGEDDPYFIEDDEEIPDAVLAKMVPRKVNAWAFLTVATNLAASVAEVTASALEDLSTLFSQRSSYEDDKARWTAGVGYEIERVDDFLVEALEEKDACSE